MATGKKTRSKTNVVDEKSSEKQTNETSIGNVKDAANNVNKPTDNEKNKVNDNASEGPHSMFVIGPVSLGFY